jgi:aspartate dehydrogenase
VRRIGIIGCGNIAALISESALDGVVVAVFDRHEDRAGRIAETLGAKAYTEFSAFLGETYDLVIEIASVEAVQTYAEAVLKLDCDLLLLSAGALADTVLRTRLSALAEAQGRRILVPSGALFGLDNAKIARQGSVETITMRSTKPPASFGVSTSQRQCLFEGSVSECVQHYPKNVNAAVALSLAAQKGVRIELWADPAVSMITHELRLGGAFGEMTMKIENRPSPGHPATSYLAALSVAAALEDMDRTLQIGT